LNDENDLGIEGVRLIPLSPHLDERGGFTEIYRRAWLRKPDQMVQGNLSISREGVLRGLHFHREQHDYWCVLSGTAFIGLYDLRMGSPTEASKAEVTLREDGERFGLLVPPGVAHGLFAETTTVLLYLVDAYFTGEDEFGLAWDDPQVGVAWPRNDPILSQRDRSNPPLADVVADPPRYVGD
jgi:dTDP-4-dehydrorhamnose 3,5-epimerase